MVGVQFGSPNRWSSGSPARVRLSGSAYPAPPASSQEVPESVHTMFSMSNNNWPVMFRLYMLTSFFCIPAELVIPDNANVYYALNSNVESLLFKLKKKENKTSSWGLPCFVKFSSGAWGLPTLLIVSSALLLSFSPTPNPQSWLFYKIATFFSFVLVNIACDHRRISGSVFAGYCQHGSLKLLSSDPNCPVTIIWQMLWFFWSLHYTLAIAWTCSPTESQVTEDWSSLKVSSIVYQWLLLSQMLCLLWNDSFLLEV